MSSDGELVVTGGSGQLGTAFRHRHPDGWYPTRDEFDLLTIDEVTVVKALESRGATALVNCAAYTAVDRAEEDEITAKGVNEDAVRVLAGAAATVGIPFVTYSTDYVFDGTARTPYTEDSSTRPLNAYGRTKLAGEEAAMAANPSSLIIRTSWVISGTHPNFVATMLRLNTHGKEVRVVDDQVGRPTVVDDLAVVTDQLLSDYLSGIVHVTNQGEETTWYELARTAVELAGGDVGLLSPCTTEEYPTPAARPGYSVMESIRVSVEIPRWRDSLPDVVHNLVRSVI